MRLINLLMVGGWPMLVLAACSVVGFAIVVERYLALRRQNVIHDDAIRLVESYGGEGEAAHALAKCQRIPGAFARIVEELIRKRHLEHAQAIETMRAVGRTQVGQLERGLAVLEMVAGVSPLIGLLGTVLGMVTMFSAITAQGTNTPQVISGGISEALITTVGGLAVAIPAVAAHALLSRRVESFAIEMQDRATSFIVHLQQDR
jgi:biopolymer transport protein ExbB